MQHRIPFFLAVRLSEKKNLCVGFKSLDLKGFVKMLVTLGYNYATDPPVQNMTIDSRSIILTINTCRPCLSYVRQFFKVRVAFHTLYL